LIDRKAADNLSGNNSEENQPESQPPEAAESSLNRLYSFFWNFLSSIKLAVFLLILLALISIIGTILPQGESHQNNLQFFTNTVWNIFNKLGQVDPTSPENISHFQDLARSYGLKLYHISHALGLDNLYHSWYFNLLLLLLSLNLIICTIRRWPHTWQFFSQPREVLEGEGAGGVPLKKEFSFKGNLDPAAEAAAASLKGSGYKAGIIQREGSRHLFAQKGIWGRFGIYVTHLSILVILLGAFIGLRFGFKGFVIVEEGQTVDSIRLKMGGGKKQLPFAIRCDDFELTYYEKTTRPSDYKSTLTVIEDGRETLTKTIEVNHPLIYPPSLFDLKSIFFYQSSYGDTGKAGRMRLLVSSRDGSKSQVYPVPLSGGVDLEEFGMRLEVLSFIPDFAMRNDNTIYSKSSQANNPAALIRLTLPDGSTKDTWVFRNFPDFHGLKDVDFILRFLAYEGLQYTGLQVAYDPGVWVVWLGCALMVIGFYIAFFVPHKRIWVKMVESGEDRKVWVAGSTSKNRAAFESEFEKAAAGVEQSLAS
jgi:cytochrome c biogenesis protein